MGYRIIYVEKCEYLRLYLDNLKVEINEKKEVNFPIADIQILVIDNYKSTLSIPLINKLTEYNVCTIICGIDHLPKSYILPINGNFASSGNLFKQIQWSQERKDYIHAEIVKHKIKNQIEILKENERGFGVTEKLYEFIDTTISGDQTNREGLAAKMYFRALFGSDFIRFEQDVVNAGLNYGYSVFRSLITSIIVAKGYIPNLGLFHKGKQNMFNLSDDIIEVFRPIVDNYVFNNMTEDILFKQSHRDELIGLTNNKIMIDDRKQTISNAIGIYLDSIFKFMDGENIELLFPDPVIYPNDI
ncbi:MAG: type II CRISPR-associated endonuclease Cas1 [Bulleidia sp.]|nr:type II CRISPR-associated endonuclease Cas1 [Bulleidia sp.]